MTTVLLILVPLLLLAVVWLWLTAPAHLGKRPLSPCRYYAHRGLHSDRAPENSLPAFALAAESGYGIELDIQRTADGVAVVFHDDTLVRMCGVEGSVRDYTYEELSAFRLAGREDVGIPTLRRVLETVGGRVPLIVELKASFDDRLLVADEALACLAHYDGYYVIESFHPSVLRHLRRRAPHVVRGQLCAAYGREGKCPRAMRLAAAFLTNLIARPHFIAYCCKHSDYFFFRLLRTLFPWALYAAWTVTSAEEEQAQCGGYDIIIFERYLPDADRRRDG